jgi:hypothetical protein
MPTEPIREKKKSEQAHAERQAPKPADRMIRHAANRAVRHEGKRDCEEALRYAQRAD